MFKETPKLYKSNLKNLVRPEWSNHINEHGLIVQNIKTHGGEGGDTLQRVGMMKLAIEILKKETNQDVDSYIYSDNDEFHKALNWLEHERRKGQYRRFNDVTAWTARWGTHCTRDQYIPLLCSLGITKSFKRLFQVFWRHLSRRGLIFTDANRKNHQWEHRSEHEKHNPVTPWNGDKWRFPDPTGPRFVSNYIRGFINCIGEKLVGVLDIVAIAALVYFKVDWYWYLLTPLGMLSVLDLQLLVDSILTRRQKGSHEINFYIILAWSNHCFPTPMVYLAKIIYAFKILAGPPDKGYSSNTLFGPNVLMDHYFRGSLGGGPMNIIWNKVTDHFMYPRSHWFWGRIRKWAEHKI